MDRCESWKETMMEVLYDEADAPTRARMEGHLASCPRCREEFASLRQVRSRLQAGCAAIESAPPRVLVLGHPPARRRRALAWLAAAAALALMALLALGRARVDVGSGGLTLSLGEPVALSAEQQSEIRGEILAAIDAYKEQDEQDRQVLVASFREELRRRDAARQNDANAITNVLMDSWSKAREDDLRFVLGQLGTLEQRTGKQMQRTEELLQHAVYTGRDQ